ncbi:MAG: archaeal proteasome endopeptidase complex subunit beta [Candidatus Aenigmarchaeota archaeon]|nr:archaeal proteasome endopeptidase complex subunit beta [Candidatus Aenigmarchaeota archaeon]
MDAQEMRLKTGTTTLGIVCKDGVLLASESKATMGYLVANKDVQKVFQIDDRMGMTVAGMVSDAQYLVNLMKAEITLYKLEAGEEMTVNAVANLLGSIMYSRKWYPFYNQMILGGVDKRGSHLFSFDPSGSVVGEEYVSTGSGSPFVYGVLEKDFRKGMMMDKAKELAKSAIRAAAGRDIASGGHKIWIAEITKEGFRLTEEKLTLE